MKVSGKDAYCRQVSLSVGETAKVLGAKMRLLRVSKEFSLEKNRLAATAELEVESGGKKSKVLLSAMPLGINEQFPDARAHAFAGKFSLHLKKISPLAEVPAPSNWKSVYPKRFIREIPQKSYKVVFQAYDPSKAPLD